MKYYLILPFIFLYHIAFAQVPPRADDNIRGDIGIDEVPTGSQNRTAGYYQKDGKYGFVDPTGVKQEAIYNKIDFTSKGFIIQKAGLYGIADKKGQVIGLMEYDSVGTATDNAYLVKKKGKYGTISSDGKKILSIKYDKILITNNFVSFVQSANGDVQMLFNDQEKVFPSKIERVFLFANLVIIKSNKKFGAVKNQLIVPLKYDSIFVSGPENNSIFARAKPAIKKYALIDKSNSYKEVTLLTLQNGTKYGLADINGSLIYPVDNDAVYNQESYGYYSVKKDNLYGIYFINGKKKTEIELDKVYADGIGYVMATKNHKDGVFDLQGTQLVPFEYDPEFIMQYRFGFRVTKNKKRGIVGKKGEIIVPTNYDDVDPFYETGLGQLIKVKSGGKFGIVNMQGKTIIPTEFEWIGEEKGLLKVSTTDKRIGLYDKTGKVIIPAQYSWIIDSDADGSNMIVLRKQDGAFNFLNKQTMQVVFKEDINSFGYVPDQEGLLNPFDSPRKTLMFVKNKNGKEGLLNETTGLLDAPATYDEVLQSYNAGNHIYFTVRTGKKYGLIDDKNKPVIPLIYDAISIDLISTDNLSVVVATGRKFGTVTLENKIQIPFQYNELQRISQSGLYKAKIGTNYQVINSSNVIINKGPFNEVANFEGSRGSEAQALTFYNGKMRVINEKGNFITAEVAMQPHQGYKTFDELKWAFVKALDSDDESLLKDFAAKIAPTAHLLYYLKENLFNKNSLQYINVDAIKEKYYNDLRVFKLSRWNQKSGYGYNRASLTAIADYTMYKNGLVTNVRREDPAFGDTRLIEKVLRDAIKINGYWISTYFMKRNFDSYR